MFKLVFDNIIFSLQKAGGISVYWFELLKRFSLSQNIEIYETSNSNIFCNQLSLKTELESHASLRLLRYFPFTRKLPPRSVFHSSYYRFSIQNNVANITTVHDFTYEYFVTGIKQKIHTLQKRLAIEHSAGIICVSENTKCDLLKTFPNVDASKVRVIYNGVGDEFIPLEESECPIVFKEIDSKQFVLFVGDRSSYKNFDIAVNVVAQFPELNLVVVGGKDFNASEQALLSILAGRLYKYKGVTGVELNWLYNQAFCLLYPSSYEGFGIPILEAMKAGCPVVSTKLSSIPEVAGDAALLVYAPTVESLSEKISMLYDPKLRFALREKGFVQAAKFSWDKCFEETMAFYKEVWQCKFGDRS